MDDQIIKALHIIFVVTWFSGLFYIVRLFIYQTEAIDKPDTEKNILLLQFALMAKRLWLGIAWPSAIITLILGTCLIISKPNFLNAAFMHIKLLLVFLLYVYHFICHRIYAKLQNGQKVWSSNILRMWNELATLFLVAIVFLIVLKNSVDWLFGTLGMVILGVVLMIAIKIYKKYR